MPKYRKKYKFGGPYGSRNMMVSSGGMFGMVPPMYGMAPPLFMPPFAVNAAPFPLIPPQLPHIQSQTGYANAKEPKPEENSAPKKEITEAERACLPFFDAELDKTLDGEEPTDIVIIDFDRTLLATPYLSLELLDTPSRDLLQYRLGIGKVWFQNPVVLEASLEAGKWNESILEIARDAANTPGVLLVVTSSRTSASIPVIDAALKSKGIQQVDHYACSSIDKDSAKVIERFEYEQEESLIPKSEETDNEEDKREEEEKKEQGDEDEGDSSHSRPFTMGSRAKYCMLELLLNVYEKVDRVFIFDQLARDRSTYESAVSDFVRSGWIDGENVYICPLFREVFHLPPLHERDLLTKVVEFIGPNEVECRSVSTQWMWRMTVDSKKDLINVFAKRLSEKFPTLQEDDLRFMDMVTVLATGDLPLEMRGLSYVRETPLDFWFDAFEIDAHKRLLVKLNSARYNTFSMEIARLRGDVQPFTEQLQEPMGVKAYLYEKRELRMELRR